MGCGLCEALEKEEGEVSEAGGLEEGAGDPGDGEWGTGPAPGYVEEGASEALKRDSVGNLWPSLRDW